MTDRRARIAELAREFGPSILEDFFSAGNAGPRTYGFEYEFMPGGILAPGDMERLREFLLSQGFEEIEGRFQCDDKTIVFEPGGQIEYLSVAMLPSDFEVFMSMMGWISGMNRLIRAELGINYIAIDYLPGREDSPLLLTSDRYSRMHQRFAACDLRGLEMMKGTAAIHLHAAALSEEDLVDLYLKMRTMARSSEFGMSLDRRNIWDQTDSARCGLPPLSEAPENALDLVTALLEFAFGAVELKTGIPFWQIDHPDLARVLDHLTTIFTDVRLNHKGGTVELRTLDSIPPHRFPSKWLRFIEEIESMT